MSVYLITYDLNHETKRPPIVEEVHSYGLWAKLSESSYAIKTYDSVEAIYDRFNKHLDGNDQLYVIGLKAPWSGFGPKRVNEWLNENL